MVMTFANGQVKEGNFENNIFIGEKEPMKLEGMYRLPSNGLGRKKGKYAGEMTNEKFRWTGEIKMQAIRSGRTKEGFYKNQSTWNSWRKEQFSQDLQDREL